jgi:5-methylcytosine-specific restriction protein A
MTNTGKLRTLGQKLRPSRAMKLRLAPKRVEGFYVSPEWRALMGSIKAERGNRCEDPLHQPEHPRSGVRIYGDHIVERKDGGAPLDSRNVLLRCPPCHQRKTTVARTERYHGSGSVTKRPKPLLLR